MSQLRQQAIDTGRHQRPPKHLTLAEVEESTRNLALFESLRGLAPVSRLLAPSTSADISTPQPAAKIGVMHKPSILNELELAQLTGAKQLLSMTSSQIDATSGGNGSLKHPG